MNGTFSAASHHDILVVLVQVSVLLLTARALGQVAQRLGQPTVVGEILAGIILGPSFLSSLIPFIGEWMIPHTPTQGYLLELIGLLGVMFLLLITGLETDIPLIRRQIRSAIGVAIGGLVTPMIFGFFLGWFIPDVLLVDSQQRFLFALFLATAMSISAIPVIAKVLMELRLTRRNIGQTIIASAMIDDTTGWILLSVVIGLVASGSITIGGIAQSIFSVIIFMVFSFTVGRWLIGRITPFVQNKIDISDKILSLIVIFMFVWGAISQALGLEALLGAFVIGIVFSQISALSGDTIHKLESITMGIFAPIFFAIAGLKVNAISLIEPMLLLISIVVIIVATAGKFVGVYIGARSIGQSDHWTALFYGAGLNARGSMGIIIATIGLSLNIITQEMFSIIVLMAIITSVMAPTIMRWTLNHIVPDEEERARLRQEEMNRDSLIAKVHRVLLPVRPRENTDGSSIQAIEAHILEQLSRKSELTLTLLTIAKEDDRARSAEFLNKLSQIFSVPTINRKVLSGDKVSNLILDEAQKDYDLLVIGATEGQGSSEVLFTPLVDYLIRMSPCPTIMVRGRAMEKGWSPKRILVPTNGSLASRRAAEVAFALVNDPDQEVIILRVVEENNTDQFFDAGGTLVARQMSVAHLTVEHLRELGELQNIPVRTEVRTGKEPEIVILDTAAHYDVDIIILGTSVHAISDRLYLGPRVERILNNAPCAVVIVNS